MVKTKTIKTRFSCHAKFTTRFSIGLVSAVSILAFAAPSYAGGKRAEIVVDADNGVVLHEMNATEKRYPASITKVMTLYLLFEAIEDGRISFEDQITYSKHAAAQSPTKLGVRAGNSVDVETAILSLVTKSANDTAVAVAERLAGSETAFAERMTAKAHELGMSNTTFKNASGLPNSQQVTTAEDLAKLAIAIRRDFPRQYHWFSTEYMVYNGQRINNHNHLVGKVDGVDGLKTGLTRASGYNLAATSSRGGHRLVTVVLGGSSWRERDLRVENLIEASYNQIGVTRNAEAPSVNYSLANLSEDDRADAEAILMDQPKFSDRGYKMAQSNSAPITPVPVKFSMNDRTEHQKDTSNDDVDIKVSNGDDESAEEAPTPTMMVASVPSKTEAKIQTANSNPVMMSFGATISQPPSPSISMAENTTTQSTELRGKIDEPKSDAQSQQPVIMASRETPNTNDPSKGLDFTVPEVPQNANIVMASLEPQANNNSDEIERMRAEAKAREDERLAQIEHDEKLDAARHQLAEKKAREAAKKLADQKEAARLLAETKERDAALKREQSRQMALKNQRGNAIVQVGAFKNKSDANNTLAMMSSYFPSFAAKQVIKFEDERGTWFRARITGLGNDAANLACKAVKSAGGQCSIVK